jgi:hypothetical protein
MAGEGKLSLETGEGRPGCSATVVMCCRERFGRAVGLNEGALFVTGLLPLPWVAVAVDGTSYWTTPAGAGAAVGKDEANAAGECADGACEGSVEGEDSW